MHSLCVAGMLFQEAQCIDGSPSTCCLVTACDEKAGRDHEVAQDTLIGLRG